MSPASGCYSRVESILIQLEYTLFVHSSIDITILITEVSIVLGRNWHIFAKRGRIMLGELISKGRKARNISVVELASATRLSRAYIHSLEKSVPGKRPRQPTAGVLIDLARALGLPVGEVFRAAGIDVTDLPMPADPQVLRLVELVQTDNTLARLVDAWTILTLHDRATITQATEDLSKLRAYLNEVKRAVEVDGPTLSA